MLDPIWGRGLPLPYPCNGLLLQAQCNVPVLDDKMGGGKRREEETREETIRESFYVKRREQRVEEKSLEGERQETWR